MVIEKNTLPQKPKSPFSKRIVYLLLLAGIMLIIFAIPKWEDVVKKNNAGDYELQDWRQDERIIELDRNDNAEQYRLIALQTGYYPCYLCEDKRIWINVGETLKIGITTNRTGRYSEEWLVQNKLRYFIDTIGDLGTVRRAEIIKIAKYPLWLENMKRPEAKRLIVPPFHRTIRLK